MHRSSISGLTWSEVECIQTTQSLDKHSNWMMLFYYHIVPPLGALQDASFTAGYVWMCFSRPHHPPPASNNNNFRSPYSVQLSTLSSILWWFMETIIEPIYSMEIEFQSLSPWHNINSLGWFTEIRMCSIVSSYKYIQTVVKAIVEISSPLEYILIPLPSILLPHSLLLLNVKESSNYNKTKAHRVFCFSPWTITVYCLLIAFSMSSTA